MNLKILCNLIERKDWYDMEDYSKSACVVDYSGYYAALCVKDDFGCVLWEPSA